MTKVGLYARVSTEEQAREGVSIDVQLLALRKWAADKSYEIIGEYVDPGHSGRDDKRPRFEMMMFDAHQGKFDIIGVSRLDRFMRNLGKLCQRLDELNQLSIGFVPLDYPQLDTSTAAGKMTLAVLGAVAEFESNRKGEQISDGKRTRISQGRWASGRTLYGYRWLPKEQEWEIVQDEAKVVRYIYHLYINENLGSMKIPVRLNSEGYRTRSGAAWGFSAITRILTHPAYKGEHYLGLKMPAIVDEATWDSAQRKREKGQSVRQNVRNWLLQGMCVCGLCGHTLSCVQKKPSKPRYYSCRGRVRDSHLDGSPKCTLKRCDAEVLEREVWRRFSLTVSDGEVLRHSVEQALKALEEKRRVTDTDSGIQAQLEGLGQQIDNLWEAYRKAAEDGMPQEQWDKTLAKIREKEAKVKELEARRDRLDPVARLEIAKLEDYIRTVRHILDKGGLEVDEHGLTGILVKNDERYGPIPDYYDLQDLWEGKEPDLEPDIIDYKVEGNHHTVTFTKKGAYRFEHAHEIIMERRRRLLKKFDISVVVFTDHVEVRGLIPTQIVDRQKPTKIIDSQGEQVTQSAYLPG